MARTAGESTTEYVFDQQGNVADRTDTSGTIQSITQYDGWGNEQAISGTPTDPFGYNAQSGYYLDRETGLYLCQHRFYDPANGSWLNRDPIGYGGGTNLYGYCSGGPVGWADNSGTQTGNVGWKEGNLGTAIDENEGFPASAGEAEAENAGSGYGTTYAVGPPGELSDPAYHHEVPGMNPDGTRRPPLGGRSVPDNPDTPGRNKVIYDNGVVCEEHPYQGRQDPLPGRPVAPGEPLPGWDWDSSGLQNHYNRHMHQPGHTPGVRTLPVPYDSPWSQGYPGENVGGSGPSRIQ